MPKPDSITREQIQSVLSQVVDPELGCNIVDLGLVYDVQIDAGKVTIIMTLTTRGCPMHDSIAEGVRLALLNIDGVNDVSVEIVWDPPWTPARMTEAGRAHVGIAE